MTATVGAGGPKLGVAAGWVTPLAAAFGRLTEPEADTPHVLLTQKYELGSDALKMLLRRRLTRSSLVVPSWSVASDLDGGCRALAGRFGLIALVEAPPPADLGLFRIGTIVLLVLVEGEAPVLGRACSSLC